MPKYFLVGWAVFLSGCATTMGGEEISRLQYGLARVHKQTQEALKKIEEREEASENKVVAIEEEIQNLKNEISAQRETLVKTEPPLAKEEWSLSQEKNNQLFEASYNDYLRGQYALAIMGFQEYLRLYPKGIRAAEAQYWLAESYFSQEDFKSAVEEFTRVGENYPESQWVASALYKKALALVKEERPQEALVILEEIIEKFPDSPESKLAQALKAELEKQIPKSPPR